MDIKHDNAVTALKIGLADLCQVIIGDVPEDQARSMEDTPDRFVKALREQTIGYSQDPKEILTRVFKQEFDELIVVRDIDFTSLCEHHLLPFIGRAHVAYIPQGVVVGLSKIPRLVDCFAKRFQLQERMAVEIANAMEEHLQPLAVGVVIQAQHQCMSCRGVTKQNASMITSVMRGRLREDLNARSEFLKFIS